MRSATLSIALQTMSFPRPMVNVYFQSRCQSIARFVFWREGAGEVGRVYHSVAGEFRIGFQDAVCGGVVSCCVHGIGTCLVEGGREPHIAGVPAGDGNFWHGGVDSAVRG